MKRIRLFLLAVVMLAGCSSPMQYMRNQPGSAVFERRTDMNDVQLFVNQQPNDSYDSLGFIEWDYYQPGFVGPTLADILPQLKAKTSAEGGDALVVRSTASRSKRISVIAEVIRFRR